MLEEIGEIYEIYCIEYRTIMLHLRVHSLSKKTSRRHQYIYVSPETFVLQIVDCTQSRKQFRSRSKIFGLKECALFGYPVLLYVNEKSHFSSYRLCNENRINTKINLNLGVLSHLKASDSCHMLHRDTYETSS